jgi:predicted AAA+ superfamily ATPase
MGIIRLLQQKIEKQLGKQKVIMLYGTRRIGKTTIIESIAEQHSADALLLQGEDMQVAELLEQRTIANYRRVTRGKKIINSPYAAKI